MRAEREAQPRPYKPTGSSPAAQAARAVPGDDDEDTGLLPVSRR
ncbi:MAG TPA: hypothetical protein VGM53_00475 [Streptosporangiaceae bacterium]